jgi:hypothetical protein
MSRVQYIANHIIINLANNCSIAQLVKQPGYLFHDLLNRLTSKVAIIWKKF